MIGVVALALRFYRLTGRSLWLDEIFTAKAAHLADPAQVIAFAQADIDQMPLFYEFTWLLRPFGDGAFVLRLQSVVAGTLAVLAVFMLARKLFGLRTAVISAVLMAVMPYAVWYSQEARNYALFMLLSTLQIYFAYTSIKRARWFDWAGLAAFTILNLYTHYLALEMTAAAATYVGLLVFAEVLQDANNRVRISVAAVAVVAAAAAALIRWRPVLRVAYVGLAQAVQSAKHHRLAVAGLIALLIVAMAVVVWLKGRALEGFMRRPAVTRLAPAAAAGLAVFAAYLPWLPSLKVLISTPSKGFGRLDLSLRPNWGALASIPVRLGLTWLVLALFVVGTVVLAVSLRRRRAAESLALLTWLTVPLVLLFVSVRWAISALDLRYFAFLFPAAMITVAVGADAFCVAAMRFLQRTRSGRMLRHATSLTGILILVLLLAQALPALATSYQAPKEDWRTTAQRISASSSKGSVVLAIGAYSDWTVLCLHYYFAEMHAPVTIVDGTQLTSDTADLLNGTAGPTWAVIDHPSPAQLSFIARSSDVKTDFVDVTGTIHVIRSTDVQATAADQARELLQWELPLQPALRPSSELLDLGTGAASLGSNVVPDPPGPGWLLSPGARIDGGTLSVTPEGVLAESNAFYTASPPPSGSDFLVSFQHRSAGLSGTQSVYAMVFDRSGRVIAVFPNGAGYTCAPSREWTRSYFALTLPKAATSLVLILRADGSGTAHFRGVQISPIAENP